MAEQDKQYGLTQSILAGVGSGVFKIFEGAATLGATLLDLGVDKNRATGHWSNRASTRYDADSFCSIKSP